MIYMIYHDNTNTIVQDDNTTMEHTTIHAP